MPKPLPIELRTRAEPGVSLWVDPIHKNGSIVVLLTDRVAGSAKEEGIFRLRKKIHYLATT